ncbi:hypothetical protein HOY82DRAFT_614885 [Tuber indicum]|nr:hypothetical protein HOY82DRAFT_614885 [Tuber indicum]
MQTSSVSLLPLFTQRIKKLFVIAKFDGFLVQLKCEFEIVHKIRANFGFGWDSLKGIPTAPVSVWKEYTGVHKEAGKYRHKALVYYDLLEELFAGVWASWRFARTGEIESEAEGDQAALGAGLDAEEASGFEHDSEEFSGPSDQDLGVIGSGVPGNSLFARTDQPRDRIGASPSYLGSNLLVQSRSSLSDTNIGELEVASVVSHQNKRTPVEQRFQSQTSKEEEAINKFLELYAESGEYTESKITKLVLTLHERKNAIEFLAII